MSRKLQVCVLAIIMLFSTNFSLASEAAVKWEYQVKQYKISGANTQSAQFLEKAFQELGTQGWELINIERWNSGMLVTFKRRKS